MFSCNTTKNIDKNQLVSVEISMITRGNSTKNIISKDEVVSENTVIDEDGNKGVFKKNPKEWDEINQAVLNLDLNKFESWEAPSQKRLYDGARGTTIKLNFKDKTLTSQTFDEGEPPAELKVLYNYLVSVVNQ